MPIRRDVPSSTRAQTRAAVSKPFRNLVDQRRANIRSTVPAHVNEVMWAEVAAKGMVSASDLSIAANPRLVLSSRYKGEDVGLGWGVMEFRDVAIMGKNARTWLHPDVLGDLQDEDAQWIDLVHGAFRVSALENYRFPLLPSSAPAALEGYHALTFWLADQQDTTLLSRWARARGEVEKAVRFVAQYAGDGSMSRGGENLAGLTAAELLAKHPAAPAVYRRWVKVARAAMATADGQMRDLLEAGAHIKRQQAMGVTDDNPWGGSISQQHQAYGFLGSSTQNPVGSLPQSTFTIAPNGRITPHPVVAPVSSNPWYDNRNP